MGIFDGIKDIVKDVAPFILGGAEVYNQVGARNDRSNYAGVLEDAIRNDYDRQKQRYEYDLAYAQQAQAASNSARAAAAGARAATERNRQKAAKKATKQMNKTYEQVKGIYDPYLQTGRRLLPQMENTYSRSLTGMNDMLAQYLGGPVRDQMPQQLAVPSIYRGG